MTTLEWIREREPNALLASGFDSAILGVAEGASRATVVVYDAEACIQILMERDNMECQDAQEFFDFNILGAWMGERTPIFLWRNPEA